MNTKGDSKPPKAQKLLTSSKLPLSPPFPRKRIYNLRIFASRGSDSRDVQMMYRSLLSLTLLASASSYTLNTLRVGSQSAAMRRRSWLPTPWA